MIEGHDASLRTHLMEVMGVMDMPVFVIGRRTPHLGVWREHRQSMAANINSNKYKVEAVSGLPHSLLDLYAGIGYFAFSYRKSSIALERGIKQVLCWELNPWSVEGLRRGAEMNRWTCRVLKQEDILRLRQRGQPGDSDLEDADFVVLETSNEAADLDYPSLRLPRLPVRHVNLGLLPSSKLSWRVAVAMLDTKRQGWIHVHENVDVKDVDSMKNEVEKTFQDLLYTIDGGHERRVCVVHVERVKMYAPGVVHCVFDICVG